MCDARSTKLCKNFVYVNEARLEADRGLPAHDGHAQAAKSLPQMLLRNSRAECAGRGAGSGRRLARTPVDRILHEALD
jgi:hypothetical protein